MCVLYSKGKNMAPESLLLSKKKRKKTTGELAASPGKEPRRWKKPRRRSSGRKKTFLVRGKGLGKKGEEAGSLFPEEKTGHLGRVGRVHFDPLRRGHCAERGQVVGKKGGKSGPSPRRSAPEANGNQSRLSAWEGGQRSSRRKGKETLRPTKGERRM